MEKVLILSKTMQVDCQPIIQKLFLDLTFKVRSKSESFVK
jgi:hypothetical protein